MCRIVVGWGGQALCVRCLHNSMTREWTWLNLIFHSALTSIVCNVFIVNRFPLPSKLESVLNFGTKVECRGGTLPIPCGWSFISAKVNCASILPRNWAIFSAPSASPTSSNIARCTHAHHILCKFRHIFLRVIIISLFGCLALRNLLWLVCIYDFSVTYDCHYGF